MKEDLWSGLVWSLSEIAHGIIRDDKTFEEMWPLIDQIEILCSTLNDQRRKLISEAVQLKYKGGLPICEPNEGTPQ